MHALMKSSNSRDRAIAPNTGGMDVCQRSQELNIPFDSPLPTTQPKGEEWSFTRQLSKLCDRLLCGTAVASEDRIHETEKRRNS